MTKTIILTLIFIIFALIPIGFYLSVFQLELSPVHSDWGVFGSFVGGVYGSLGFFAIAYSIYMTTRQFIRQQEDQIFYKAMDSIENRVSSFKVLKDSMDVESRSGFKFLVEKLRQDLEKQSVLLARKILCKKPESISDIQYNEIFTSIEPSYQYSDFSYKKKFIDSITLNNDFNNRWERLKHYIGSVSDETEKINKALYKIGSSNFYKVAFPDRLYAYQIAYESMDREFGELLNGYMKCLAFVLSQAENAANKNVYKRYLFSQLTKYELIVILLMIDCPSSKNIETEIACIKERVNK